MDLQHVRVFFAFRSYQRQKFQVFANGASASTLDEDSFTSCIWPHSFRILLFRKVINVQSTSCIKAAGECASGPENAASLCEQ
mmetsp:Transcript_1165/g.3026  ORF Transcript_1165/g.3026 Transcript_1165/m.3026 type:complete len:83 (+) Transcript_1165:649-897(+)